MNWKKQVLALGIVVALLCSMVPASAAGFTDITDSQTAQDVEVLQMMNIINGVSAYSFQPDGILTRAQFTKMAVMALGKEKDVASYKNYTIFPDVKSSHWASGYVNLAVRGENKFIAGFSDGSFGPEQAITFGQAVTILMRLLGYTDQDVGMVWPTGYISAAATAGLTDGVYAEANSPIARSQAAKLFVNLLNCKTKDGANTFAGTTAATVEKDTILLDCMAKADDGSAAIETTSGIYMLAGTHAPTLLQGRKGDLLLNAKGEAWGFVPSKVGSAKDITVATARSGKITDTEGKEYEIKADAVAYYDGEKTTYGEVFINLRSGTFVTLHFGVTGKVESLYVGGGTVESAMVIGPSGSAKNLDALTGGRTNYTIIRQGEEVTASQLRTNDVATFHPAEGRIYISTLRLSGYYQSAYPNAEAPSKIKLLGQEFTVLPSAIPTISKFKVGDKITVLLTRDFQVAAAANPTALSGNGVGIASVSGGKATVELLEGLTVSGSLTSNNADTFDGLLVSVSSYKADQISITPVKENTRGGSFDVAARTYGSYPLASGAKIFERVGNSAMEEIQLDEIRMDKVPSAKIQYSRVNDQGKVDMLILDNVSGDRYVYGIAKSVKTEMIDEEFKIPDLDGNGKQKEDAEGEPMWIILSPEGTITQHVLTMQSAERSLGPFYDETFQTGQWGGIAVNNTQTKVVSTVKLQVLRNVSNENFLSEDSVRVGTTVYDVSEGVVCYNHTTGLWCTLNAARAFSGEMTLYVDDFHVLRAVDVR